MDPFSKYKTEEIDPIANEEDNKKCFQCQASPANWVCVYNAIFLCASCAGEHRAFGTRLSCIKSLVLDKLNPFQVETMKEGGNAKAKTLLVSNWKDYKQYEKIVVFSSKLMEYHRNNIYDTIVGNPIQPLVEANDVREMMEKSSLIQRPILTEVPVKVKQEEIVEEVKQEDIESQQKHEAEDIVNKEKEEEESEDKDNETDEINKANEKRRKEEEKKKKEEDDRIIITKEVSDEPFIKPEVLSKNSSKKQSKSKVSEGKTKERSDCSFQ